MKRFFSPLLFLVFAACGSSAPPAGQGPAFLPPVGVEVPGSGEVPSVLLAVATTRAGALDLVIEPLVTAIHAGLAACPAFVERAKQGGDSTLVIALGRGALQVEPPAAEDNVSRCMAKAIDRPSPDLPTDPQLKARVQVVIQEKGKGSP